MSGFIKTYLCPDFQNKPVKEELEKFLFLWLSLDNSSDDLYNENCDNGYKKGEKYA